ncbi:Mpv17/PMP22 protein [Dioscorea alata]|uniref:Mpv17/PMP22 protein n=1 Tax=Dioscorea alata TaxID=55571 RepID=A0ACB7TQX8_DIOAL|nr:Mpv17/PMP22 protein [Dioscorea alata]
MDALGGGGFWRSFRARGRNPRRKSPKSSSESSIGGHTTSGWSLVDFPFKQAAVASSLTLAGDTIAQARDLLFPCRPPSGSNAEDKDASTFQPTYDWLRAMRMASYGFLLYGPGTYVWYQFLDRCMPNPTLVNLSVKVLLNQIILGPSVIAVIFAWNNLWLGKLSDLPNKYQKDALPTLLYGFRFWIPVTILNFGLVPLSARVAFMSTCSIFWNFYLSSVCK